MLARIATPDTQSFSEATHVFQDVLDESSRTEKQTWHLTRNPEFRRRLKQVIEEESAMFEPGETRLTKLLDPIEFPASTSVFYPLEAFTLENGFSCRESFKRLLPLLRPVIGAPRRRYGVRCLKEKAFDEAIIKELPERHLGKWEDIVSLKEMYPEGDSNRYLIYLDGGGAGIFSVFIFRNSTSCCLVASRPGEDGFFGVGTRVMYDLAA